MVSISASSGTENDCSLIYSRVFLEIYILAWSSYLFFYYCSFVCATFGRDEKYSNFLVFNLPPKVSSFLLSLSK